MKKNNFNATFLRSLLLISIILIVVVIVGGFYFAQNWLANDAANVKAKNYNSTTGTLSTNELIPLQSDINNHEADSAKAASLISSDVGFENSIHQDLNKYAAGIGISVTSISPIQPPSFESTVASIAGIEPEYVSITIGNPIQFTKLLEFIQAVETNIPKMRITGIDITNDANQDGSVTVKPITVEVYTE